MDTLKPDPLQEAAHRLASMTTQERARVLADLAHKLAVACDAHAVPELRVGGTPIATPVQ